MSKRISNGCVAPISKAEAMKLLRTKCLPDKEGLMPGMELLETLMAAYPDARLPSHNADEPSAIDWQMLAWQLAIDFVPAFKEGKRQGRTAVSKPEIVSTINRMVKSGEAKNITQACGRAERLKMFPELTEVRRAYYRAKQSQKSHRASMKLSREI